MLISESGGSTRARRPDADRITVTISTDGTSSSTTPVGSARQALASSKITGPEKTAIRNILRGMELLRAQNGAGSTVDDALDGASQIVLRVNASPAADHERVLVPPTNPFTTMPGSDARTKVLFPMDVAVHELTHLVQESASGAQIGSRGGREQRGMGGKQNLDAVSVAEGLADASSMLTLGRWDSGGEYFGPKSTFRTVRDYDHPKSGDRVLSELRTNYNAVRHMNADPHVEGGLAGMVFHDIEHGSSNAQALIALHGVLADPTFRGSQQGWWELSAALKEQASQARERGDARLASAIESSLTKDGLA